MHNYKLSWMMILGQGMRHRRPQSKGIVLILVCLLAPVLFGFLAYSVDTGLMSLTLTRMQNACDAAALAASEEIRSAIAAASAGEGDATIDAGSVAVAQARDTAVRVAAANGVYVDGNRDVIFGRRSYDEASGTWPIAWGDQPYNVVRVVAHRDNPDTGAPDAELPLNFAGLLGKPSVPLTTGAIAFFEARDLVLVLDYSGSMCYDSQFRSIGNLSQDDIEANMAAIFEALQPLDVGSMAFEPQYLTVAGRNPTTSTEAKIAVTFKTTSIHVESTKNIENAVLRFTDGRTQAFTLVGAQQAPIKDFAGTGTNSGKKIASCWVKSGTYLSGDGPSYGERFDDTVDAVKLAFNLTNTPYPYPQGSWTEFVNYVRTDADVKAAGYERMYGGMTLVNYLLDVRRSHAETPDLWKTPEYPFHAMKEGVSLLFDFLGSLEYADEVGIISYATTARWETELYEDGYNIDISDDPITMNYEYLDIIQRHRQAAHYSATTATGDGVRQAREMLQQHCRYGSRPTVLVITDGNANEAPSRWSLPSDWDWNKLTDYDGDGLADYVTNDRNKQYAFWQATEGMDLGYTFHTMSVGADADRDLMKALAFVGKGTWIDVPGGSTVAEMQEQMLSALSQIAGRVPPPMLICDDATPNSN